MTCTIPHYDVLHFYIAFGNIDQREEEAKSSSGFGVGYLLSSLIRRRRLLRHLGIGLTTVFKHGVLGQGIHCSVSAWFSVSIWMEKSALQVASEDSCSWSLSQQCFSEKFHGLLLSFPSSYYCCYYYTT